jgi:RNA polymerase sigma factor (sigma-70 family)
METKSDGELLEASRRGEHEAFGQLVARYQDLVCAVSFSSTGDDVLSEDVAQDTFIAAWRQLAGLREPGRLRPWLCGIARNLARKARKARRRDELVDDGEPIAEGNPFDDAARGQVERLVRDALERVPATYREVLVLYYRENQSIRDVAAGLGITETAVEQRLSRGRRYLADGMTSLVESSLRGERPGERPRRDLVAAVLAAIAVTAFAPHVDANPRSSAGRPKGSTMLKLALAATATVAAGTGIYLLASHGTTKAPVAKHGSQPALRLGAGTLGLAHAPALGPTAAPRQIVSRSVAEADLAYVPADAEAVLGFNIAQLQHSALWQQFVAKDIADSPELKEFVSECGFDPLVSLAHVTVGVKGLQGGTVSGTVVVHGFAKAKAMACFNTRALPELDKDGPHVKLDQGVVMIDSPDRTSHAGFTFLDDSTALVVFGPAAETRQGILDVASGGHGLRGTPGFTDALSDVNTDASMWAMLSDASSIVGSVNGAISPYTQQKLGTVYFSIDVSDAIAFDAGVHLGSAADVARAVATITSQIDAIDPNKTLRQYFDQLDVFADGSDLIFSVAIAGNQILPLAGALAMQHAGSISASANMTVTTDGSDD